MSQRFGTSVITKQIYLSYNIVITTYLHSLCSQCIKCSLINFALLIRISLYRLQKYITVFYKSLVNLQLSLPLQTSIHATTESLNQSLETLRVANR